MKKYIISYASTGYYDTQKRLVKSIVDKDIKIVTYTDKWLKKKKFYRDNCFILDQKRGAGYWLWKPFILLETFKLMNEGDVVIYCDADAVVLQSLSPLYDLCIKHDSIMLFDNSVHLNKSWIKRDCYILMDADTPDFYNAAQAMGGFIVLKKNIKSEKFLTEWLDYASDYRISTDSENELGEPNLCEFIEHRHDQAILSILRLKWKIPLFRDPSQFGNPYKMPEFRNSDDYLINGVYENKQLKQNSPYSTLIDLREMQVSKNKFHKRVLNKIYSYINRC